MVLLVLFLLPWAVALGYLEWTLRAEAHREQVRAYREQLQKQLQTCEEQLATIEQVSFVLLAVSTALGSPRRAAAPRS